MTTSKTAAARRLTDALQSDLDFAFWLDGHPHTHKALDKLLDAIEEDEAMDDINQCESDA